jgi:sporulation protein YlmC with PRC-barrel domain
MKSNQRRGRLPLSLPKAKKEQVFMRTKRMVFWSAALVVALGSSSVFAQQVRDRLGPPLTYGDRMTTEGRTDQIYPSSRASEIIGMRVENQLNERLGTIRDVVLDFQTGRIAYVVLATPEPQGERYIAVPPAALITTRDPNRIFLSVDRERLARIPGFDRHNWPDIDQPFWGAERFWGSAADTTFDPAPREWEQDRFTRGRVDRYERTDRFERPDRFDRPDRFERPDRTDRFDRTERWTDDGRGAFRGTVVAINPEARTMSVEAQTGEVRHFEFAQRPNIQLFNLRNPRLVDIRVGYPVNVGYSVDREGTNLAHTVIRTDRPEVR